MMQMQPKSSSCCLAVVALFVIFSGCSRDSISEEEKKFLRDDYVRLDNVQPQRSDDFALLESRAHAGVDPVALSEAFSGNRVVPRAIAESFAKAQRMSEAEYWLQIGAENGDGISMQQLSITLRKRNCGRANYWLEKSLETNHLPSLARSSAEQDLEEYKEACIAK
jgi:hypothetical protein